MAKKIIIDCERMKYAHTGLYHYCHQLCSALIEQPHQSDLHYAFYTRASTMGFLGNEQKYVEQKWWHKLYNPQFSEYDLWHGTYQGTNYFPTYNKIKKLLTIHDLNFLYDENKSVEKQKKYLHQLQQRVNQCDQLTVISQFTLQCLKDHIDLKGIPTTIIYNGCNQPADSSQFEQPAFIQKNTPYLFSIGTITDKKNFHTLPAILVGNDYRLVIAGINQNNDYLEKIIDAAKKHGVADRLILPGAITENEKWWLMQNMEAFVFPSLAEGFGLPVVEAMNFGRPVILSNKTCLPEIGGSTSYYFNSFDPADMQATLQTSLQHFESHPQQAEALKKRAADFSWPNAAKEYTEVYKKLLGLPDLG